METATKRKAKRRHLNAQECRDLQRSAEGTSVLTQPHLFTGRQNNRGPYQQLYPRLPKRKLGSPGNQQRSITHSCSVSRVLSSSLWEAPDPCSSTNVPAPRRHSEPTAVKETEEEEDDVSLLAMPINQEIEHLGGVADMFASDEEFECCRMWQTSASGTSGQLVIEGQENTVEEVEAIPDAHYGLLGSSEGLVEPQGSIDDLPVELLKQVLCLLPAQDLFRSAALVCYHWKNIVEDPKFVPQKKLYYRYLVGEEYAISVVPAILLERSILNTATPELSVVRLVLMMAQHRPRDRVRPEDAVLCLRRHRLFPQAEACLRVHMPDSKADGLNPYASMAVMLLLSEGVDDVQQLVAVLSGCMSRVAIVEFLSQMATYILCLRRKRVQISNRVHYNIFCTLHLMENASFSVSAGRPGGPHFQVTREQQMILSHDVQPDHVVKILAFAGTGKTTTLVKYAEQRPHLRFLYAALNKSAAKQARRCFPRNVACRCIQSMAFSEVGERYRARGKLTFDLTPLAIAWVLPQGYDTFYNAKVVTMTLKSFMASADVEIGVHHVPNFKTSKGEEEIHHNCKLGFMKDAQELWDKIKNPNEMSNEGYFMPQDGYLKLWQLQHPKPCLSEDYDVILLDEAQDCSPAIMDILLSQRCAKILVGDPHRQSDIFQGAVDLYRVPHTHLFYLTRSFQFGSEIAYVGATILQVCKNVRKTLVGGSQRGSVSDEGMMTLDMVRSAVTPTRGKTAILSHHDLSVFCMAIQLTDVNPQCRFHVVGGFTGFINKIIDVWLLMQPGRGTQAIRDPFIHQFAKLGGFWVLKKYASETEDLELQTILALVRYYKVGMPQLVNRLNSCHEDDSNNADFILGTIGKAKGRTFDTVIVNNDFSDLESFSRGMSPMDQNLLYTAVTCARSSLVITKAISHILTFAGEYFLKTQMMSSVMRDGQPPHCCIEVCCRSVRSTSGFVITKRPMTFGSAVTDGNKTEDFDQTAPPCGGVEV